MYTLRSLAYEFDKKYKGNRSLKSYINILDNYKGFDWCWKTSHNFEGEYYKRLIFKNDFFDIYVITWKPRAHIDYHDHSENGCIFKILHGSLEETKKKYEKITEPIECKEKTTYYIDNDIGLHSIKNNSDMFTYSIHVYSPPNYKCEFFNSTSRFVSN